MAYDAARATAARMIKAKGAQFTITRSLPGASVNPVTQAVEASGKPQTWRPWAIGKPAGKSWQQRGHNLIGKRTEELVVAPEGYVPERGDDVLWKGRHWNIVDWIEADPDGSGLIALRLLLEA